MSYLPPPSKKRKTQHKTVCLSPLVPRSNVFQLHYEGTFPPAVHVEGNFYRAFEDIGSIVVDKTNFLASRENQGLVLSATWLYFGFASPSDWSIAHTSSSFMMYHDIVTEKFQPFIDKLAMSKPVKSRSAYFTQHTHACLDIEFLERRDSPAETNVSLEAAIRGAVAVAVDKFVVTYRKPLKLPDGDPPAETRHSLDAFLSWMSEHTVGAKLFVTVRHLQRLFGRFLDAAMWEDYCDHANASTLLDRLETIRRLVLVPLWRVLGQHGIVRKLLVVGPFLIKSLVGPDDLKSAYSVPSLWDLSHDDSLHGLTRSEIESAFTLIDTSSEVLQPILDCCNRFSVSTSEPDSTSIYTQESVSAVCSSLRLHLPVARPQFLDRLAPNVKNLLCETYAIREKERVMRTLYPALLRDSKLADLADGLLQTSDKPVTLKEQFGPGTFSLDDLVSAPTLARKASRFFLSGLLAKVEDGGKKYYALAGGCARAVLQAAVDEAKKIRSKIAVNVDAVSLEEVRIPEKEIARLILEYFSKVPPSKQPKDEAEFQAHFAEILRAIVERHLRGLGFSSDVQIEVWLRNLTDDSDGSTVAHFRFDVAVRIRSKEPGKPDRLYIFELKYFSLDHTREATHAHLSQLYKGREVLESQVTGSSDVFWQEMCSIRPPAAQPAKLAGWYVQTGSDTPARKLSFDFLPEHIHCYFYVDPTETKAEASKPAAMAPQPASKAPQPASKAPQPASKAPQPAQKKSNKTRQLKKAVEVVHSAADQARNYMKVAALGIGDQLGSGLGFADARITDLGEGETIIIAYSIVNIAGALVNVKCLGASTDPLLRKIAIVGAYPWTPDPTTEEVDAIYDAKKEHSENEHSRL